MGTLTKQEKRKVRKPLLWVGIASIVMTFAGLTSGYYVSYSALMAEDQWLQFALPNEFYFATGAILLSSFTMAWAKSAVRKDDIKGLQTALLITLALGLAFAVLQFLGWADIKGRGLYFTGEGSNTAVSWVYVITALHWLHVISGIIVLIVTFFQSSMGAYSKEDHHGLDISAIYWHFLDGLWIYLFLFLVFIR